MGLAPLRGYKTLKEAEAYLQGYRDGFDEEMNYSIVIYKDLTPDLKGYWVCLD